MMTALVERLASERIEGRSYAAAFTVGAVIGAIAVALVFLA
ncbi:MAG: hypothetical protein ABR536_02025 [Solirubrobacterales bacterium]